MSSNTTNIFDTPNTEEIESTSIPPETAVLERRRKVIGYAKVQPGYQITLTICLLLVLNMVIFGVFALIAHFKEDDSGLIKGGFKDAASYYLFFLWNSFMWSVILLCPSVTTDKREKCLPLFYLSGCSTFLLQLSDLSRTLTKFQMLVTILVIIFSYLLYMAFFNLLYAFPEEWYEASPVKPWKPIYEDVPDSSNV